MSYHLPATLSPPEWICNKSGSCVRHFSVSLVVWAKSQDSVNKPQFLKRKESRCGSNKGSRVDYDILSSHHCTTNRSVVAHGGVCILAGKSIGVDCSGPQCGDHMTCTGSDVTRCACSEGYEENTFNRCGSAVNGTCSSVEHCANDMECSENSTCVCRSPLIVKADGFCGRISDLLHCFTAVSYTHLTLPTKLSV